MNLANLIARRQLTTREWRTGALILVAALLPGSIVILPLLWLITQRFGRAGKFPSGAANAETRTDTA